MGLQALREIFGAELIDATPMTTTGITERLNAAHNLRKNGPLMTKFIQRYGKSKTVPRTLEDRSIKVVFIALGLA